MSYLPDFFLTNLRKIWGVYCSTWDRTYNTEVSLLHSNLFLIQVYRYGFIPLEEMRTRYIFFISPKYRRGLNKVKIIPAMYSEIKMTLTCPLEKKGKGSLSSG